MGFGNYMWSALRNWGQRFGSIITLVILARILPAEDLGLFATVLAIVAILELVSENGLGDAVIRSKSNSESLFTYFISVNILIAVFVFVLVFVFSDFISGFYSSENLGDVLRMTSVVLLLNSLAYIPQAIIRKQGGFKRLAVRSLVSMLSGSIVGVSLALNGFGVWSMVAQLVTVSFVNLLLVWSPKVFNIRFPDSTGSRDVVCTGFNIFLSRTATYFSTRVVELVIPYLYGAHSMGVFFVGSRIPYVLNQLLSSVMLDVNFPRLASISDSPEQLKKLILTSLSVSLAIGVPIFLMVAYLAKVIVVIVFGAAHEESVGVVYLVCWLCLFNLVFYHIGLILNATGNSRMQRNNSFRTCLISVICFFALSQQDFYVFVTGFVFAQLLAGFVAYSFSRKFLYVDDFEIVKSIWPYLFIGVTTHILFVFLRYYLEVEGELEVLFFGFLWLVFYFFCFAIFFRELFRETYLLFFRKFKLRYEK